MAPTERQLQAYCGESHVPKWTTIRFSNGIRRPPADRPNLVFTNDQEEDLRNFLAENAEAFNYDCIQIHVRGRVTALSGKVIRVGNGAAIQTEDGFILIEEARLVA